MQSDTSDHRMSDAHDYSANHSIFTALVNKGNVLLNNKDYEKAREYYQEALQNDSSCVEALYNQGECYRLWLESINDDVQNNSIGLFPKKILLIGSKTIQFTSAPELCDSSKEQREHVSTLYHCCV